MYIHPHPLSPIKKLLLEAVRCWKYRWEQNKPSPCPSTASQSVGKAGLETKIHHNCTKCRKGWDQSPVARPGLGVRRWDIYIEYLRMRGIMYWEVRGRWMERGNVLFQVEQGMCRKAGQEGAQSWLPGHKGLTSRPETLRCPFWVPLYLAWCPAHHRCSTNPFWISEGKE